MIEISPFWDPFCELFWNFSFAKSGHRGRLPIEIRAFIRKANHNKMSGHGFERHTSVLELGLRGATHALRVLSSRTVIMSQAGLAAPEVSTQ